MTPSRLKRVAIRQHTPLRFGNVETTGWHALTIGKGVGTVITPPFHALPDGQGRATHDDTHCLNATIRRPWRLHPRAFPSFGEPTTLRPALEIARMAFDD